MEVPITFTWQEKEYSGIFSQVSGSGPSGVWQLIIKEKRNGKEGNYYYGQLFYSDVSGWQFGSNIRMFEDLAEWFGNYLIAYLDGI